MMRTLDIALRLSAAALLLGACQSAGDRLHVQDDSSQATISYASVPYTPDQLAEMFVGRTVLIYDAELGNQVEYFDPEGLDLLWHPASPRVLPGAWKLQGGRELCTRNGAGGYNPITLKFASQYQCRPLPSWQRRVIASTPGNVFNLQPGETRGAPRRHPAYASLEAMAGDVKTAAP